MGNRKRSFFDDDAAASMSKNNAKRSRADDLANDDEETRRGCRSKNMSVPNATASVRGSFAAKTQGKKTSKQKVVKEVLVPMKDPVDTQHERVVFVDNETNEPVMQLLRKTEKAEPMSSLWANFLGQVQSLRDQIGVDVFGSTLTEEESKAIDLKNNYNIFPTLITSKGGLRSKDNLEASTNKSQRNEQGTFSTDAAAATPIQILTGRAESLEKKAVALKKQAAAYLQLAEELKEKEDGAKSSDIGDDGSESEVGFQWKKKNPKSKKSTNKAMKAESSSVKKGKQKAAKVSSAEEESPLAKCGMAFIGEVLPLSRKELDRYIIHHEEHLTVTAEKLRNEMAGLATYVQRAEKRLRDLIQLKVAADLKICRDIKKFNKFEVAEWQMGAFPSGIHACQCAICSFGSESTNADFAPYRYDDNDGDAEASRGAALLNMMDDDLCAATATTAGNSGGGLDDVDFSLLRHIPEE